MLPLLSPLPLICYRKYSSYIVKDRHHSIKTIHRTIRAKIRINKQIERQAKKLYEELEKNLNTTEFNNVSLGQINNHIFLTVYNAGQTASNARVTP